MPPRVIPASVVVHGGGETCVEVSGPQVEEERIILDIVFAVG